jgi:hypothetical protein
MAKIKYTRHGEKPQAYQCTNRKCKWQGKDDEKLTAKVNEIMDELVCPSCGKNEFFGLLLNK